MYSISINSKNNYKSDIKNINNSNKTIYYNNLKKEKNLSQKNLKFNGIINLFEKINLNNFKRSRSLSFKDKNNKLLDSRKKNEFIPIEI